MTALSSNSVYRAGCLVKGVFRAAVMLCRCTSEAADVRRCSNIMPRRTGNGRPSRCQSLRRQAVISRNTVTLVNPSVYASGSSQPHDQCFESADIQCLTEVGRARCRVHRDTLLYDPHSVPAHVPGSSMLRHHAHYSWLRRAWLSTLVAVAVVGLLGTPVAANTPPRFVLDGQSEIVIRLTEGEATPVGKYPELS